MLKNKKRIFVAFFHLLFVLLGYWLCNRKPRWVDFAKNKRHRNCYHTRTSCRKLKTDAQDKNLKGKVKSITKYDQDLKK